MKRLLLLFLSLMIFGGNLTAQTGGAKYYSDTLLFAFGKHYVSVHHRAIDSLTKLLKENPNYYIRIVGHTDTVGSDKFNLDLSRKRARRVVGYLMNKGFDSLRMESQWRGYHQPIATNGNDTGRRYNCRVNMFVIYSKTKLTPPPPPPPAPPKPEPKVEPPKPKVDTVVKKIDPPKPIPPIEPPKPKLIIDTIQYDKNPVAIVCDHQTIIFGPKGSKITIPPKSFDCNEKFTLELTEFFKQEDMVMHKMHTMTKKDVLDAQSILCVKAYSNGKPQSIKPASEMLVELPAQSRDKEARVYVSPGTGAFTWKQYTAGNDIPSFDPDYKRYNIGLNEVGCVSVAKKCENKEGKTYLIDLKLKRLYDKAPQVYYVSKENNSVAAAKKDGNLYRIENICEPGAATLVAIQVVEGEPALSIVELKKKQIEKLRAKGKLKVKMKFRAVTKEELEQYIKESI